MKIALLSCDDLTGYVHDDHLLTEELRKAGHQTEMVSWSQPRDWRAYDMAVLRTTWDYTKRVDEFLDFLDRIETQTRLYHGLPLVKWNLHKRYLLELETRGVAIIPTLLFQNQPTAPAAWTGDRFVVKPAVAAGGFQNQVLTRADLAQFQAPAGQDWLLQPFLEEIHHGEISLLYFGGRFSHAIRKVPKAGEFRVQEEHGGTVEGIPADPNLQALGAEVIRQVPHPVLYARVDVLKVQGRYLLMEIELIEPSLYFRTHPEAAKNFRLALEAEAEKRSP